MEVKLTVSQIILALLTIGSNVCTALGIAYYFGKKVSSFEVTVKYVVEKVDDVSEEVKTLTTKVWEIANRTRGR